MLLLEEYIHRRKKEDRIDEFDLNQRAENMKVCVNYVFEYFNNYLNITEAEERTTLKTEKLDRYRKELRDYDKEVQDWLVAINSEYSKKANIYINNVIKEDKLFFIYNTENEFRALSYDCYSKLIKKLPFLKNETEMLFLYIKEYFRIQSQIDPWDKFPFLTGEIEEWLEKTYSKYQVNFKKFANEWVSSFYDDENSWPVTHRKKAEVAYAWHKYEYDYKQKTNLFNLDSLYRKLPKKAFIKGRKQELEILLMYYWLHSIDGDEDYWQEYLEKVLPTLNQGEESL